MDVINRLKSTITTVVTGNPLVGEFEILDQRASGGPGMLWKVYDGVKRSTKQETSIFVCEKKLLERYHRRDREVILDTLKKGVSQLTRLRHPKLLSVIHPVEESREVLAFATEPVLTSLSNVLGCYDNLQTPVPSEIRDFKLYDVEIKYGLLHLTEALCFLHNDVKMVHHGLSPSSIFINRNGAWKLAGFDHAIPNANTQDQSTLDKSAPYFKFRDWAPSLPPVTQPSLDYLAPEFTLTKTCDTSSDMFSLGVLLHAIFNGGKPVYECRGEWNVYQKNAEELKRLKVSVLGSLPEEIRDHVKMLLNTEPSLRPDADQIGKIPFFEDVGAMTLQYMDSLVQRDNLQKSQFFKGLPKVLSKMPKRVCIQRILPAMFSECTTPNMIPFVLPNIVQIGEHCTEREFATKILPGLVPIFKLQEPIQDIKVEPRTQFQITLVFLQNMNLLLSKTPQNDIRNHVLPMVYRAMEAGNPQIQEMCLNIIPTFASLVEYSQMKSALVPRIIKICLTTNTLRLRVNCLVCLGKLLEYMDKWYVLDEILPVMPKVPSREPAVLMSMLGIFRVAMSHKKLGMTKEAMASKVLPFLLPMSIDNNLNLQQFNAYYSLIREMVEKVETEHRAKLEQLDSMQQEQRTLQKFAEKSGDDLSSVGGTGTGDTMMDKIMSGFGIGNLFGMSSNTDKAKSEPKNPFNDIAEPPTPKPADTQLPNQPAKTNLTMSEKQKLAKDQELQERLKQQPKLAPQAITPKTTKSQVKDLTASLMSTDFMASGSNKPATGMSGSTSFNYGNTSTMGSSSAFGMGSGSAFGSTAGPTSSFGGLGTGSSSPAGFGQSGGSFQQPNKKPDMSAFDNLLPASSSSQNRQPLNKMNIPGNINRFPAQQSTMGMQPMAMAPMGNTGTGMMGNNMGMMGNRPPMGMQPMGNPVFGQTQPGGMSKPQQQNGGVKPLSNQDLADFLG